MSFNVINKIIHQNYKPVWRLIDAQNHICGRLATNIATILTGKDKPYYDPSNINCGDNVVVINVSKIAYAKPTYKAKVYYSHSRYPGGLKKITLQELIEKNPTEPLRRAVYGMLPRNRLRKVYMSRLHLFLNEKHIHQAQLPDDTIPFIKGRDKPKDIEEWQTLQFPGINYWPDDFGDVVFEYDGFPEGKKSEFDIIDYRKLHEEYIKKHQYDKK